ncbi:MAG: hypothetical protein QF473_10135, partial [Planctomycetota bacterium]|nr:hypothetical protein [Planctomycetota bacterium]
IDQDSSSRGFGDHVQRHLASSVAALRREVGEMKEVREMGWWNNGVMDEWNDGMVEGLDGEVKLG